MIDANKETTLINLTKNEKVRFCNLLYQLCESIRNSEKDIDKSISCEMIQIMAESVSEATKDYVESKWVKIKNYYLFCHSETGRSNEYFCIEVNRFSTSYIGAVYHFILDIRGDILSYSRISDNDNYSFPMYSDALKIAYGYAKAMPIEKALVIKISDDKADFDEWLKMWLRIADERENGF